MIHVTDGKILNEYPVLKVYDQTMKNLPKMKEYLEDPNCPEMWLNFNNKHAKINGNIGSNYLIDKYVNSLSISDTSKHTSTTTNPSYLSHPLNTYHFNKMDSFMEMSDVFLNNGNFLK